MNDEDFEPTDAQLEHYYSIDREIISPRDKMIKDREAKGESVMTSRIGKNNEHIRES